MAAGLAALSITGWLVYSALNMRESSSDVEISDSPVQQLIGEVMLAQQQYHMAIEELEALAFMRIEELPEELAAVFVDNLAIVNDAISLYESSLIANQTNFLVYDTLSKIYKTKIDLLTSILRV